MEVWGFGFNVINEWVHIFGVKGCLKALFGEQQRPPWCRRSPVAPPVSPCGHLVALPHGEACVLLLGKFFSVTFSFLFPSPPFSLFSSQLLY